MNHFVLRMSVLPQSKKIPAFPFLMHGLLTVQVFGAEVLLFHGTVVKGAGISAEGF